MPGSPSPPPPRQADRQPGGDQAFHRRPPHRAATVDSTWGNGRPRMRRGHMLRPIGGGTRAALARPVEWLERKRKLCDSRSEALRIGRQTETCRSATSDRCLGATVCIPQHHPHCQVHLAPCWLAARSILLRASRGHLATTLVFPTAVLETQGAKSGIRRRNTVIYFHDGGSVIIVPSNAGAPRHPAWYHNLRAHPEVVFGGIAIRAAVVEDESERARLWVLANHVRVCELSTGHGRRVPHRSRSCGSHRSHLPGADRLRGCRAGR